MKILLVAWKYLLEIWREPQLLLLTIFAPAAMMLVMAFGYGQNPRLATFTILVDDQSGGLAREDNQALKAQRYADGRPMFHLVTETNPQKADERLRNKEAALLLVFSKDDAGKLVRTVKGDGTSMAFITASGIVESVLNPIQERREGLHPIIDIQTEDIALRMAQTEFDAYAPGVMIMAILLLIPQTAMLIGRELRMGTIKLLQMSPLHTVEWFAGISLAQMAVAVVQVVSMLGIAKVLGFHTQGSLGLALLICLILSFGSIGLGLLVSCLIHNDSEAINTGSVFSMMQVFLSGAFFPFNAGTLLTINGHQMGIFDILPATQGMMILRQSLVSGAGFQEIAFRLIVMTGLSVIFFFLGIVVFNHQYART
jgi:ABC-type multidrug transport system permease subunit